MTEPLSLVRGGPFYRLLRAAKLVRADGPLRMERAATVLALGTWLPLAVIALWRHGGGQVGGLLSDLSVHARLLVAIPMLLFVDDVLDWRCQHAVARFVAGRFIGAGEDARLERALALAEKVRDSNIPETVLAALAVLLGQAAFWGLIGPAGLFSGGAIGGSDRAAIIWYVVIALPVFQFVAGRALWHWLTWCHLLVRFSRLRLQPVPTHPDRCGGLGHLSEPTVGVGVIAFAANSVISAAWTTQTLREHVPLQSFVPYIVVLITVEMLVAFAPFFAFAGHLKRTRLHGLGQYSGLALRYTRLFHDKWIENGGAGEKLLGTPDIQSLNDMMGAFGVLSEMRLVPFERRSLLVFFAIAIAPLLPLPAIGLSVTEVAVKLGRVLLGHFPP